MANTLISLLSKYYEPICLCLFALYRMIFNYAETLNSYIAALVFPMLTLKLYKIYVKYPIVMVHFFLVNYLIGINNSDSFLIWSITGLIILAIAE